MEIFKALKINDLGYTSSHLQYANDTIIFVNSDTESIQEIKIILQIFHLLLGLKVNFNKSLLYGFHEQYSDLQRWANLLECEVGEVDIKYLGANISASSKAIKFWDPLLDKMKGKLAAWESINISQAGRLVLLKATLDSLPSYSLSLFKLSKAVENNIEVMRRKFFWGCNIVNNTERDKLHLLNWSKVCKPKKFGGLGLTSIKQRNSILFI